MDQHIYNVSPLEHWEGRTYGNFHILPREQGKRVSPPLIIKDMEEPNAIDLGENNYRPFPWRAEEIARDLVREHLATGCFVAAGAQPTAEELAAAEERWLQWCQRKVSEADAEWTRTARFETISDDGRKAARELGVERPWIVKVRIPKGKCGFCEAALEVADPVKCPACGSVLNIDKALAGGLISLEQADTMREARGEKAPRAKQRAQSPVAAAAK